MTSILRPLSFANTVLAECASTNDLARELAEAGYPQGAWVAARKQTRGRGRQGRAWVSEEGGLYLSMVVRITEGAQNLSWIPIAAGLAAIRALDVPARLKWPNDVYLRGKKLGGILCEGAGSSSGGYVVVGVGVNYLSHPKSRDLIPPATSVVEFVPGKVSKDLDSFREKLIEELRGTFTFLPRSEAVVELRKEYDRVAELRAGQEIEWAGTDGRNPKEGKVRGLGESGELLVSENGRVRGLFAEEVRLRK